MRLAGKHRKTLTALFADPVSGSLPWQDIESLLAALGSDLSEGGGSRIRVHLNGVKAVFHRPHPRKEAGRGAVRSVRRFLLAAGINTEG